MTVAEIEKRAGQAVSDKASSDQPILHYMLCPAAGRSTAVRNCMTAKFSGVKHRPQFGFTQTRGGCIVRPQKRTVAKRSGRIHRPQFETLYSQYAV